MSLKDKLDEIRSGGMKMIPADKLAIMQKATADLRASGIAVSYTHLTLPTNREV